MDKSPPPPANLNRSLALKSLWQELPTDQRQRALLTLSRLIALQLAAPPDAKEVAHEQA